MECEFKYGEKIEVSDYPDFPAGDAYARILIAYDTDSNFKFVCRSGFGQPTAYKYARKIQPRLQPGQPIIVWDNGGGRKWIVQFSHFNVKGQVVDCRYYITWDNFKLLDHYDYTEGGKYDI